MHAHSVTHPLLMWLVHTDQSSGGATFFNFAHTGKMDPTTEQCSPVLEQNATFSLFAIPLCRLYVSCVWVCVGACLHVYVCAYLQRPEVNTIYFETVSHWTWNSPTWQAGWWVSPRVPPVSSPPPPHPVLVLQRLVAEPGFNVGAGIQTHILLCVQQAVYLITQLPTSLTPFNSLYFYTTVTITCFPLLVSRASTLLSILPKRQRIQGSTPPGISSYSPAL